MKDLLYKGHFKDVDIAFTYAVTTATANTGVTTHDCDPVSAHILARALTAGLLSSALLPDQQRLNACWKYDGALRTVVVDAGSDGTVRGFLSPTQLHSSAGSLDELYGKTGNIQIFTSEDDKILNSGTSEIALHDVVNDFAFYYCMSHQIETEMMVMVGFSQDPAAPIELCQGWMLQALPGTDLELFTKIRNSMHSDKFRALMANDSAADGYFEELAKALFENSGIAPKVEMDWGPTPNFKCTCNHEKISAVVKAIPSTERMEIVQAKEDLTIRCQFCNKAYIITIDECSELWNEKK